MTGPMSAPSQKWYGSTDTAGTQELAVFARNFAEATSTAGAVLIKWGEAYTEVMDAIVLAEKHAQPRRSWPRKHGARWK